MEIFGRIISVACTEQLLQLIGLLVTCLLDKLAEVFFWTEKISEIIRFYEFFNSLFKVDIIYKYTNPNRLT